MKTVLVATSNPGKISEWKTGLQPLGRTVVTLRDVHVTGTYEENGSTFEENAIGKANFFGQATGYDTIGDDGGVIIPVLGNEPGVHTRRWKGYEMTDDEFIAYTLERLHGVPMHQRRASIVTVAAYVPIDADREPIVLRRALEGYVAERPYTRITPGYPFRALFIVGEYNTYYEALTAEQHTRVNQHRKTIEQLVTMLLPT